MSNEPHEYGNDLRDLGKKQRAGRALSEMLRAIGTEMTEVALDDGPNPGPPRIMSKAERMARHIWKRALPHKDDEGVDREPDLDYIKIILDRVEGKPGSGDKKNDDTGESLPDKISRMNATRINDLAKEIVGDDDNGETGTGNSVPE